MPVKTPLSRYKERLKSKELHSDAAQEKAVVSFQRLYDEIMEAAEAPEKNLFQKLTGLGATKKPIKGIYIYGGVGRGKSMLMDMFYDSLPDTIKKRRVHFHQFMIEVHDYLHQRREQDEVAEGVDSALPALASRISEASRILCFDEFHVTDVADAMILGRLFTALFDREVIVVTTSNWPPDKLYEGGLQRDRFLPFIKLLKDKLEIIHLDSKKDYRTQFLQEQGTYFWPMGDISTKKSEAVFAELSGHKTPASEKIEVKGREIIVEESANGAARFTFAQLCEQPHGAEDYLAIAGRYHTVFLENVPKLGYDRRNEAKRLMTLIDALYDTHTNLIVTADAPPDKLYRGHDHEFEFRRTVSRLLEMQSAQYLQDSGMKTKAS